jgi:hypothetical protein
MDSSKRFQEQILESLSQIQSGSATNTTAIQ